MTVSSTLNREQYATNGVTTAFTIHFPFFNDTDVNAIFVDALGTVTTLALNADFTVSGGGGAGGSLLANTAPADGGKLTLYREIPFTQEDDYVEDDPLPADTLEGGFDRGVMRDQQLKDSQDRALTFPVTVAPGVSGELPIPVADYFLRFAPDGLSIVASPIASLGAVGQATEGVAGIGKIGTQPTVNAGTNDTDFVTPKKLANSTLAAAVAAITAAVAGLGLPFNYITGLDIANNATDANNDIDTAAGKIRSDDDTTDLVLAATIVKRLDAAWAVGTNQGGLDTGTKTNGATYFRWLIKRPDTGVVDVLFSASPSSPTMPTNYTKKRRLPGGIVVDGSGNIRAMVQRGGGSDREFIWATPTPDTNAANPGTSAVTRTLTVPVGIRVKALLEAGSLNNTSTTIPVVYLSDLAQADVAPNVYNETTLTIGGTVAAIHNGGASSWSWANAEVWTNTSAQIRSRASASDASTRIGIITRGWVESLQ